MKKTATRLPAYAWLAACVLVACSVDPNANKFHKDCNKKSETRVGEFCVPITIDGGGSGHDDGGKDSGPAADGGGSDAGDASNGGTAGTGSTPECTMNGEQDICYTGDKKTASVAPCHVGTKTCMDGEWSSCVDERKPIGEGCNNVDDDCDGTTDEDLDNLGACSVPGEIAGTPCAKSHYACQNGGTVCPKLTTSVAETCNGVDDDCDGTTDENMDVACFVGTGTPNTGCDADGTDCKGACVAGSFKCTAGVLSTSCTGETAQGTQGCTGMDEDCDGLVDENCSCNPAQSYACYTGAPGTSTHLPCKPGTRVCNGDGTLPMTCTGETTPVDELCNGTDDDCDGDTDDDITLGNCQPAGSMNGTLCAMGTLECQSGSPACVPDYTSKSETCNTVDDDCDGNTDESFNLQTDENNCGSCGTKCVMGNTCCGGQCVNTQTDKNFCGGCNTKCSNAQGCCGGACKNIQTDRDFCGAACRACPDGLLGIGKQNCVSGVCE